MKKEGKEGSDGKQRCILFSAELLLNTDVAAAAAAVWATQHNSAEAVQPCNNYTALTARKQYT